jgi:hypothetical protein
MIVQPKSPQMGHLYLKVDFMIKKRTLEEYFGKVEKDILKRYLPQLPAQF